MSPKTPPAAETIWLTPGQRIIEEGKVERELYVLLSGAIIIESSGTTLARITEYGEVIGELGALTGRARTAGAVAEAASEVLVVRKVNREVLRQFSTIQEKIDLSIGRRFQIMLNKARLYTTLTATLRRTALQEVMWEHAGHTREARRRAGVAEQSETTLQRQQVRRRIDEALAMAADPDDPRVLDRLASEYGVQDRYRDKIAARPWLDDAPVHRLDEISQEWTLLAENRDPDALVRKAELAMDVSTILAEYERMPGIRHELGVVRMESLIPQKARMEALKSVYCVKQGENLADERQRLFADRQLMLAVEAAKADAGRDVVMLVKAAKILGVEKEYEGHLRNMMALSETSTLMTEPASSVEPPK